MIKHFFRIVLIFMVSLQTSHSQILKGRITNPNGEPIQYATVYIQELKQGTTANTKGDYELRLPPGKYMVIYQSLGFEPIFADITMADKPVNKNVTLPIQYYVIPEVRITASGEDPAYIIMRKVIGMAPYYLSNVSYYKAEVYLKGNLVINRIPKIIQKTMKMEAKKNSATISVGGKEQPAEEMIKEGDSFLMESFNEMEFTAPDKYVQRVISFNSTFPEQGNEISPMDFIEASFYHWLPVSHKFDINIGIVGFKADAGYGSSVKYLNVKPNLALAKPKTISTDFTGKPVKVAAADTMPVTKTKQQIEKLLEKDQLNNRDMVKLSKLMDKESKNSMPDSSKNSLEIKDNTTHIIEKDANKKDSAYWAQVRPIPLSEVELRSIRVSDSLKGKTELKEMKSDSAVMAPKKQNKFVSTAQKIFLGHTWADTSGFRFTYGGLFDLENLRFNSVDGFVYGLDFSMQKSWKNFKQLYIAPEILWAFNREDLIWRVNTIFRLNTQKLNQIFLRTGVTSTDINNVAGINPFINSITSLLLKKNYMKLYESRYVTFGYMNEIVNGFRLEVSANFEDRRVLQNSTNFSLLKRSTPYSDNIPVNDYLAAGSNPLNALRDMRHADFSTKVSYTPYQKYRMRNGRKISAGSDWPTFTLTYQHGIDEFSEMTDKIRHTDMLRFETGKRHETGAFSEFRWRVRTGGYFDNRDLTFYDFFHVNSQPLPVLINNYEDAFMLPSYYSMSTPEFYGEVHLKYTTPYLLIKLLPGISNTLMRENLSLSYLGSRYHKNYTELGYSISEVFFLGEIGVYVGFEDVKYKSVGGKLVFKFN
ncbi:MAG: carboxypeptidase-like regulatory domain-containing protein [Bacteroidales bacterium]|nr:carboxypeptidase-like regulatory domain-containing protein [Bacteroidales bacterium]